MPLRIPARRLTARELDDRLARGDRRSGLFLYRTDCPSCRACQSLRVLADQFVPSRTQRRVWKRGSREMRIDVGMPQVDQPRINLFNAHRRLRGLASHDGEIDAQGYATFLSESCCDTLEISYRLGDQLVAVALCDIGARSVSAVYCYFDPQYSQWSPGTFSILKQIDFCRRWSKRYLYLGYYISTSPHMSYKSKFQPHERLIDGQWRRFDQRSTNESATVRIATSQVESET